jgi:peptide/nickel transport system substrate-binding protein
LLKLNINATLNQLEWGAFLAETAKPIDVTQTDLFLLGWTTVTADADYGLFPLFHSSASSASNRTFFRNAQVDAYLDIGRSSLDQNVRKAAYEAAQEIIRDELPWVFLQTRENVSAISNKVSGFRHHPMGAYNLANVSKND